MTPMVETIDKTFESILSHLDARMTGEEAEGHALTETDTFRTLNFSLMLSISHYIEDRFVEKRLTGMFIASFQKLSFFVEQQARYLNLARTSSRVMVFAEPDIPPPVAAERLKFYRPAHADLDAFWVVLSDDPEFRIALVARETTPSRQPAGAGGGKKRTFEGFWTYRDEYIDAVRDSICGFYADPAFEIS
jgi:DICT domain-containing protein